jgi:hypothetical protein
MEVYAVPVHNVIFPIVHLAFKENKDVKGQKMITFAPITCKLCGFHLMNK